MDEVIKKVDGHIAKLFVKLDKKFRHISKGFEGRFQSYDTLITESQKDMQKVLGLIQKANAISVSDSDQDQEKEKEKLVNIVADNNPRLYEMQTEIDNLANNLKKLLTKGDTEVLKEKMKSENFAQLMTKEINSLKEQVTT